MIVLILNIFIELFLDNKMYIFRNMKPLITPILKWNNKTILQVLPYRDESLSNTSIPDLLVKVKKCKITYHNTQTNIQYTSVMVILPLHNKPDKVILNIVQDYKTSTKYYKIR